MLKFTNRAAPIASNDHWRAPILEIRRRNPAESRLPASLEKPDNFVGSGEWDWVQNHRIYNGKDGGIRSDAKRECQHRHQEKPRSMHKGPTAVPDVVCNK
jgi:hypothetical protein